MTTDYDCNFVYVTQSSRELQEIYNLCYYGAQKILFRF